MVQAGGSAFSDECVIDVIEVLDTNRVAVKVFPLYEGGVNLTMVEGQSYNFIDFQVPFQVTPKSVFYGDSIKAASFIMCNLSEPPEPTLSVSNVVASLAPSGDIPEYNRYGVYMCVTTVGTGTGLLRLNWGTDHTETTIRVSEGVNTYSYNLPPGQHSLCADLFSIEL